MKKTSLVLAVAGAFLGASPAAFAHSYYNLTGAGTVASGNSAIGFGIANSINGTDGVSNNSNGTNRVANGTNTYTVGDTTVNTLIPGTGTAATSATEAPGNLPYMWYSGQHTTAAGVTKRELFTGTSATDNVGNLSNVTGVGNGNSITLPNGAVIVAPGTGSWGTNTVASLWNAYSTKNGLAPTVNAGNAASWGTIMADLPGDGDHPYLAVAGNSASTGAGVDYGLIHISCGTNTASDNCASAGDVLTTISVTLDKDYPQYSGLLDVALYRNIDTSSSSDRTLATTVGATGPQGSNLGAPIWTASMSSAEEILYYSFIFNQAEWVATGTPGYETNAFYTLMVGAHGGSANDGVTYNVLVTTSPVPVPAAVWLFGSALAGLVGIGRRKSAAAA